MEPTRADKARVIANSLYQRCAEGDSMNTSYDPPRWGYMVSIKKGPVFKSRTAVKPGKVQTFIEKNISNPPHPLHYFGVWTDEKTNLIHFDLSEQFATLEAAMVEAKERKQIAIYDVKGCKDIRL